MGGMFLKWGDINSQHRTLLSNFFMKQYFFLNSNPAYLNQMEAYKSKFVNNLTLKQRVALESLTKNKNIAIIPSHKDNSIVILDKEEYDKACVDILVNTNY